MNYTVFLRQILVARCFRKDSQLLQKTPKFFAPCVEFLLLFLGMRSQPKDFPGLGFWRSVLFQHKTGVLQDLVPENGHPQGIRRFRTWSSHHGFFGEPCKTWGVYICKRLNATFSAKKSGAWPTILGSLQSFLVLRSASVVGPVPGPAGSHGETCNAPFAIRLGCGRAFGRKKRRFFWVLFRTGMFKMGQTFWGSIKQPSGGSQSRAGF